jgi:4-aminobutyrate aminotransferase-like enzyme
VERTNDRQCRPLRADALAPIPEAAKSSPFSTGAEATENAIKIARAATGRSGVIAFTGGFHGRTIMAMSMTGKVNPYKKGVGPSVPEVWHVPFPLPQQDVTVEDSPKYLSFLVKAVSCGTNANTIRVLVPLTASDAIIDEGLGLLEKSLAA